MWPDFVVSTRSPPVSLGNGRSVHAQTFCRLLMAPPPPPFCGVLLGTPPQRRSARSRHFCATSSSACADCSSDMERPYRIAVHDVGSCREHAQATTDCSLLSAERITHQITAHIIVRFRGRQGGFRYNGVQAQAQASPRGGCMPQKLTRPDGESGRVSSSAQGIGEA